MNALPEHGTPAGDAFLAIQKLARSMDGDVQELLTLYALEGVLARVARSPWSDDFVLKGGVLLAAFDLRRPTKDIDLQVTGLPNDVAAVLDRVRAVAAIDLEDGLVFPPGDVIAQPIREEDEYAGVRVRLIGQLGRSRLAIGVDVNFGDPIWPRPAEIVVPRLVDLGQKPLRMLGYPLAMVVAEKVVTVIERAEANTRWRDFADVFVISGSQVFGATELRESLNVVADYRGAELRTLLPALEGMPDLAQSRWMAWRRRQAQGDLLPATFAETLAVVAAFVDPILDSQAADPTWDPRRRSWS